MKARTHLDLKPKQKKKKKRGVREPVTAVDKVWEGFEKERSVWSCIVLRL